MHETWMGMFRGNGGVLLQHYIREWDAQRIQAGTMGVRLTEC